MSIKNQLLVSIMLVMFLNFYAGAALVGTASIKAPAVIASNDTGSLTVINLTVTDGTGSVSVVGPENVGESTTQSAHTAAEYASSYLNLNFNNYNFTYAIMSNSTNVSGPSAGAAMTLLAVSALSHKQLRTDFTITGTISEEGLIGQIGGVYNKVSAAKQSGLELVLVPAVPQSNPENELYLLTQTNFGIPLVQVSDITNASFFAFNKNISGSAYKTSFNFYTDYKVGQLQNATLDCINSCDQRPFNLITSTTFNLTNNQIKTLASSPNFYNVSLQLKDVLVQAESIANKGYLYTAANLAFLDFINAFYFSNHNVTVESGFTTLSTIQNFCSSLLAPDLTSSNYEYVLSAELRQAWGNYTASSTLNIYNSTAIEGDIILSNMYAAGQAYGWCSAANLVYNYESNSSAGYTVVPSDSLRNVAQSRINRATPYGVGIYLATAQQAYEQNNYPLAILAADYAFSIANSSLVSDVPTGELINMSNYMSQNSTYSAWATEFSKESQFYVYESMIAQNDTSAHRYAVSAYSAALLAQEISSDMKLINENLIYVSGTTLRNADMSKIISALDSIRELMVTILILVVLISLTNLLILVIVITKLPRTKTKKSKKMIS